MCNLMIQIAHGFSGSKKAPPKTTPKDYLPFPEWESLWGAHESINAPTEITKDILKNLLMARRIPMEVYITLSSGAKDAT